MINFPDLEKYFFNLDDFTEKFHKASDEIDKEAIIKVLKESIVLSNS